MTNITLFIRTLNDVPEESYRYFYLAVLFVWCRLWDNGRPKRSAKVAFGSEVAWWEEDEWSQKQPVLGGLTRVLVTPMTQKK